MIIFVLIILCVFYFMARSYARSVAEETIARYSHIVDDVFFEKDKKIEDLEFSLCDMQSRIESLEDKLSERNKSNYNKYGI